MRLIIFIFFTLIGLSINSQSVSKYKYNFTSYNHNSPDYSDDYIYFFGENVTTQFTKEILEMIKSKSQEQFSKSRIPWTKKLLMSMGKPISVESLYENRKKIKIEKESNKVSNYKKEFFIIDPNMKVFSEDSLNIFKDTSCKILYLIDDSLGYMQVVTFSFQYQTIRFLSGSIHTPYYKTFDEFKKDINISYSDNLYQWIFGTSNDFYKENQREIFKADSTFRTKSGINKIVAYNLWMSIHIIPFTGPPLRLIDPLQTMDDVQKIRLLKEHKMEKWFVRNNRYDRVATYIPTSHKIEDIYKSPEGYIHIAKDNPGYVSTHSDLRMYDRRLITKNLGLHIEYNKIINNYNYPKSVPSKLLNSSTSDTGTSAHERVLSRYRFLSDSFQLEGPKKQVIMRENNKETFFPLTSIFYREPLKYNDGDTFSFGYQFHVTHLSIYECPYVVFPLQNHNISYQYKMSFNVDEENLKIKVIKKHIGIGKTVELINITE